MKRAFIIIALAIAFVIVGVLLNTSQTNNANYRELLVVKQGEIVYLESQLNLCEEQASRDKAQIAQLQAAADSYKGEVQRWQEEAQYWQDEAELGVIFEQTGKLRKFSSVEDLRWWLDADPISEREYFVDLYDCDDFAIDLTLAALADGYWIGLGSTAAHMFNFTIIGNNIYKIEAQYDGVEFWTTLD